MPKLILLYVFCAIYVAIDFYSGHYLYGESLDIRTLTQEGQEIESLTVLLFIIAALLGGMIAWQSKRMIWWLYSYFMAMAAFRENDMHKAFTDDSILKTNFYLESDAPLGQKLFGIIFIIILIYMVYRLAKYAPQWIRNVFAFQRSALIVFWGFSCLFVAKTIDSIARLLPFMTEFRDNNAMFFAMAEESLELMAAATFLHLALTCFQRAR